MMDDSRLPKSNLDPASTEQRDCKSGRSDRDHDQQQQQRQQRICGAALHLFGGSDGGAVTSGPRPAPTAAAQGRGEAHQRGDDGTMRLKRVFHLIV